ncbi:MAG TPA: thermonuclease family protein [Mariprofundaceae bacterium]|nr:thermonuclease family protein [Mariprofundaceae bacterium]
MMRRLSRLTALWLLLLLLFDTAPLRAGTLSIIDQSTWVKVAYVYDGDTFRAANGDKIRLLGINTPEITHGSEPGEPMGKEAAAALRRIIGGKTVRLEFDQQRHDIYGRLLAQVYLHDGTWVNGEMVRFGYAHIYTFTPNLRWAPALLAIERPARQQRLGIWHTKRFAVLPATRVGHAQIGQFRLVRGSVDHTDRSGFGFRLARLHITVPRKYRSYFDHHPLVHRGEQVVVHGVIRANRSGNKLFLALHSPDNLEIIRQ